MTTPVVYLIPSINANCSLLIFTVQGSKIKPDPLAGKNEKRRKFCSKYDGYGDFCEGKNKKPPPKKKLLHSTMKLNTIILISNWYKIDRILDSCKNKTSDNRRLKHKMFLP